MPSTGELLLRFESVSGTVARGVTVEFTPLTGDAGSGGESVTVKAGDISELTIKGIPCRGGPGTMYRVRASAPHFRRYGFFQPIKPGKNRAADTVEFWIKPKDVTGIAAPAFATLPAEARAVLTAAAMTRVSNADTDLLGLSGQALYAAFGPLRQACFLNIVAKASDDTTAAGCLSFFRGLLLARQDRVFVRVESTLPARLRNSRVFKTADPSLHDPLPGYVTTGESFKSRDAHANLQVTFMRETTTGELAADIDIDESSGIEHGLEVIENAVVKGRTNPYLIHEFLLAADPVERSLDPGYQFMV